MRGNFSLTKFPLSERGSLWMQQGRPLLDSDWNAQTELTEENISNLIQSLVGPSAAPAGQAGFEITPIPGISLNDGNSTNEAEGIFLLPDSSLPFSNEIVPILPFHALLGFTLHQETQGTLCHIPGLFVLSISDDLNLTLSLDITGETGVAQTKQVAGKTILKINSLQQLDIVFNGQDLDIHLRDSKEKSPELSLTIDRPSSLQFDPIALLLGCQQKDAVENEIDEINRQYTSFSNPLAVFIWQLAIYNDIISFEEKLLFGEQLREDQAGLVCLLDFTDLMNNSLYDRSPFKNNGIPITAAQLPSLAIVDFTISKGNYLAFGKLYRNLESCLITNQPNLPLVNPELISSDENKPRYIRFFLDCWKRLVTDLEAPENHDPVLNNIDTTADLRDIWQVKYIEDTSDAGLKDKWAKLTETSNHGKIKLRKNNDFLAISNGLLRLEIHHSGWNYHWPLLPEALESAYSVNLHQEQNRFLILPENSNIDMIAQLNRPLLIFTAISGVNACPTLNEISNYALTTICGIERLDGSTIIHITSPVPAMTSDLQLFLLPIASFKYSEKNGCLCYPVAEMDWTDDQKNLAVDLTFPGYNGLEINTGDWVELGNLSSQQKEVPGPMFQVNNFVPDRLQLTLSPQQGFQGPVHLGESPTLTLWDGDFTHASPPVVIKGWAKLSSGIEVQFEDNGFYRAGQYWTAAIREALPAGLVWPGIEEGKSEFILPEGPNHNYVPLSDIVLDSRRIKNKDIRDFYRPLVDEPFADLDKHTAEILFRTAHFMELLGIMGWPTSRSDLPQNFQRLTRYLLDEIYHGEVRLLGTRPIAPEGLITTGQTVHVSLGPALHWKNGEAPPKELLGEGVGAELAGQPIFVNTQNNSIWGYGGSELGWNFISSLPDDRRDYSVAWDARRLYIVGGWKPGWCCDRPAKHVLSLNSVGKWRKVGSIRYFTAFPAVTCFGDQLLVAGGTNRKGQPISETCSLDLRDRHWHTGTAAIFDIAAHSASIMNGNLWLIFGGKHAQHISDQVYGFEPASGQWHARSPMPIPLFGHQVFKTEHGIFILGGKTLDGEISNRCFLYDPNNDLWHNAGRLLHPRTQFGIVKAQNSRSNKVLIVSGTTEEGIPSTSEEYSKLDETLSIYR